MKMKLFSEIKTGFPFHFYDKPERILVKQDKRHYVAPEGRRQISPSVLVVEKEPKKGSDSA